MTFGLVVAGCVLAPSCHFGSLLPPTDHADHAAALGNATKMLHIHKAPTLETNANSTLPQIQPGLLPEAMNFIAGFAMALARNGMWWAMVKDGWCTMVND